MEYKFKDHTKHCWHCKSTKMVDVPTLGYHLCLKCGATYRTVPELSDKIEVCGQLVQNILEWESNEVRQYGPRY